MTKKKVELTTKRQIETRVKRQVVLEDGKVVEDSGPIVTTNTTEDTEKQETSQTEVSFHCLLFVCQVYVPQAIVCAVRHLYSTNMSLFFLVYVSPSLQIASTESSSIFF